MNFRILYFHFRCWRKYRDVPWRYSAVSLRR